MDVSIVFLSRVYDEDSALLLKQAVESCVLSVKNFLHEIIIVESGDKEWAQRIVDGKAILLSYEFDSFNFHKALNMGLCKASGKLICFSNNDVVFHEKWLENLQGVMKNYKFDVASPVDPEEDKLWMIDKKNTSFIEGYEIQKHFKGWCFVVDRKVFKVLHQFDETFDFYFADTDFITQVEIAGFKHAVVLDAHVHHLEKKSQDTVQDVQQLLQEQQVDIATIPDYVIRENRWWMVTNKKMIEGLIKYHDKWGKPKTIQIKKVVSYYLTRLKLNSLTRLLFLR